MAGRHETSLVLGRKNGVLVHVSEVDRGLQCQCACPECGEPLIAKRGPVRADYFSHTSDTSCNPSPETLTHRYAKELIARQAKAILPAFEERVVYENHAGFLAEVWGRQNCELFLADSAEVEYQDLKDVVPDVLLRKKRQPPAAGYDKVIVEVHFRHPVPEEKIERIRHHYLPAVEVCLSDLPTDSAPDRIQQALAESWRWTWLNKQSMLRHDIQRGLELSQALYFPKMRDLRPLKCASSQVPSQKLELAEKQTPAATAWLKHSKALASVDRHRGYLAASLDLRLAIHCCHLGVQPRCLPLNLMQNTHGQSLLKEHAVYWQTWIFGRFCIGERTFSAHQVARAMRGVFRLPSGFHHTIQSDNGFSGLTKLVFEFLMQLAQQDLVFQIDGTKPWLHQFKPRLQTQREVATLLSNYAPALKT